MIHPMFWRVLLLLFFVFQVSAQKSVYGRFDHVQPAPGASVIGCMVQDTLGMMWIGTNKGLFSYDGHTTRPRFEFGKQSHTRIYCGLLVRSTHLYLGADNGLLIYNIQTDRYEEPGVAFPSDIRALALYGNFLYLGTLNGLYCYHLTSHTLRYFNPQQHPQLSHHAVYSLLAQSNGQIWIGTYNGFCSYNVHTDCVASVPLPALEGRNNLFVNALCPDSLRQCIWLGVEGALLCLNPTTRGVRSIESFRANSVKSLALDESGNLLVGTDNGLYVYSEQDPLLHFVHDSRNRHSLADNIVWTIFSDRKRNIWLGTDNGVSLSRDRMTMWYVPISEITGTGEGNQFYSIFRDSRDFLWLGGTNGLIRVKQVGNRWGEPAWFNMDDARYPLSHGRIRHIYEDSDGRLWIATDGSIHRYDMASNQFVRYNLIDRAGVRNANWAYSIYEDQKGTLWVGTCLGGILGVSKQKLLASAGAACVADVNLTRAQGLSGMFVNQLVPDDKGRLWALLYNNGIDCIYPDGRIEKLNLAGAHGAINPTFLLSDQKGLLWAGFNGGVMRIDPDKKSFETVFFNNLIESEVLSMAEVEGQIWVSTTDGLWLVNKNSLELHRYTLSERSFLSVYYDSLHRMVYLGDVDGLAVTSSQVHTVPGMQSRLTATFLEVNGKPFDMELPGIRFARSLDLHHWQNNIALELSDFSYGSEERLQWVYRLEGVDTDWSRLPANTNRISYNNLSHGAYRLQVCALNANGDPMEPGYVLRIEIHPPWYLSLGLKAVYLLLVALLIGWIVNFFRVKHRLKIERIEKEKIVEQTRMKMEFLTTLSHELKTPLSLIVAPVSRMLASMKDEGDKNQLQLVQRNAMKLNALIHQLLDFNRIDTGSRAVLIRSRFEMVSFSRHIFSAFEPVAADHQIRFLFEAHPNAIKVELDAVQMESIITNLLSNAVKYTPPAGTIKLSIHQTDDGKRLLIEVSDTGTGIPGKDLPFVFQRFFQSSLSLGKKEGTGVGLYLVKTYTELHGGKVTVNSVEGKGTLVQIEMPCKNGDGTDADAATPAAEGSKELSQKEKLPLVLVVDDQEEIVNQIETSLRPAYHCIRAANGAEGLEACNRLLPDLVITDERMPEMSGLEMCRQLRRQLHTSTLPVILLTALHDREVELESIHLQVDAFILKPFEPAILRSRVDQLLQKNQKMREKIRIEAFAVPGEPEAESHNEKFLALITHLIEDHLPDTELNVAALSEWSSVNQKQLYRKIKQLTGMTPVEYIRSVRMKKAAMLLRQQKFSVAEVMYLVGFSNHSYFAKCFKAEWGKTPWQYREEG